MRAADTSAIGLAGDVGGGGAGSATARRDGSYSGLTAVAAIDGGVCPAASHMTIIDCSGKDASLVRAGMVHQRAIAAALGRQP
jgi:L-threonylcarbamoyladenylate synthase